MSNFLSSVVGCVSFPHSYVEVLALGALLHVITCGDRAFTEMIKMQCSRRVGPNLTRLESLQEGEVKTQTCAGG